MPAFFVHHKISLNVTVHLSILLSIIILTIFWQVYINHRCFFLVYINLLFNFMLKACKKFTYLPSIIKLLQSLVATYTASWTHAFQAFWRVALNVKYFIHTWKKYSKQESLQAYKIISSMLIDLSTIITFPNFNK